MKYRKWNIGEADRSAVDALRSAGYSGLLASVLAARGVTTPEAAAEKLERERKLTLSPLLMKDMDRAVARIQQAIADGETMAVFGDYDVDGITSTVLLMDYLRSCGVRCLRHIPRRIEEGYGLSKDTIQSLRDQGATLMITVDCGITGNEEGALKLSAVGDTGPTDIAGRMRGSLSSSKAGCPGRYALRGRPARWAKPMRAWVSLAAVKSA